MNIFLILSKTSQFLYILYEITSHKIVSLSSSPIVYIFCVSFVKIHVHFRLVIHRIRNNILFANKATGCILLVVLVNFIINLSKHKLTFQMSFSKLSKRSMTFESFFSSSSYSLCHSVCKY